MILTPVEMFNDKAIELAQIQSELGIRSARDTIETPDSAQALREMEELVEFNPEIVDFYAGALDRYTGRNSKYLDLQEKDDAQRTAVIADRISVMADVGVLKPQKRKEQEAKLATGELIIEEAQLFFAMFKHRIDPNLIPRQAQSRTVSANRVQSEKTVKRQRRVLDVTIEQDSTLQVNGKKLDGLSEEQHFILMAGVAKHTTDEDGGFRHVEIYKSPEFMDLVGVTDIAEAKALYETAFSGLKTYLAAKGFARLVDPVMKKHQRKHSVVPSTVTDMRTQVAPVQEVPARAIVSDSRPVIVPARPIRFYDRQSQTTTVSSGDSMKPSDEKDLARLNDAHDLLQIIVAEKGQIKRRDVVAIIGEKFSIDVEEARGLVAQVYARVASSDNPRFKQQKIDGAKCFVIETSAPNHEEDITDENHAPFGSYFEGSFDDLTERFGAVKGMTPGFINYERGIIRLKGLELAVLEYFDRTGQERAISQKALLSELRARPNTVRELAEQGVILDKQTLRQAVAVINNLYGREFLKTLPPSSRLNASKGPRIQRVGSWQEIS